MGADRAPSAALQSLQQYALAHPGHPERGRELFQAAHTQCSTCHRVQQQGGEIGPDLSQIGGKFDRVHLIESILEPSRQIVEGYRLTTLVLSNGQVMQGIVCEETEDALTLVETTGGRRRLSKAQIEERSLSNLSPMPEGLAGRLTPEQFTDLIAYLESLRPGGKPTPGERTSGPLTLPPGFRVQPLVTGLTACTALEIAPDGRVFICEQTGALRVVEHDRLVAEPALHLDVDSRWERGLIGVTIDPAFATNHYVYLCYVAAKPYPHHCISRWTLAGNRAVAGSEKVLFEGDDQTKLGGEVPAGHQGGAIHFGRDGKLYVALGDQTAGAPAQSLRSLLGKILRLNSDGSIPHDNPFYDSTDGKYRAIWARGLRNPFAFAVQRGTGRMFICDVGGIQEEINEGIAGANFGWPIVEHGPTRDPRFRGPVHHYPTASIVGGDFSPADLPWPAEYRGRFFFLDFVHGWIRTLDPDHPAQAGPFASGLRRPTDLRFAPDGSLYVLVRDAWVIDDRFKPSTGSLWKITCTRPLTR